MKALQKNQAAVISDLINDMVVSKNMWEEFRKQGNPRATHWKRNHYAAVIALHEMGIDMPTIDNARDAVAVIDMLG